MGVFVVGMHRSGTSAMVRLIESLGYGAGDEVDFHPPDEHDPTGHREHILMWRANELALAAIGRSWDDPVGVDWTLLDDDANAQVAGAITAALQSLDAHRPWVAKDPRLCLTLPLWRTAIDPVCVMTHRDPMAVARSLAARDQMPVFGGLALWEWYQRAALVGSTGLTRVFVSFADFAADPHGFGAHLASRLDESTSESTGPTGPTGSTGSTGATTGRNRPSPFEPTLVRQQPLAGEVRNWLNPAQARLLDAVELSVADTRDCSAVDEALADAAAEPVSEQAVEVLRNLAAHRRRLRELEARDHEISQWNEHLQGRLAELQPPTTSP